MWSKFSSNPEFRSSGSTGVPGSSAPSSGDTTEFRGSSGDTILNSRPSSSGEGLGWGFAYQYGPGFPSKNIMRTQPVVATGLTGFLKAVAVGNWSDAYNQLGAVRNASPSAFQGRRVRELDLMRQLLPPNPRKGK